MVRVSNGKVSKPFHSAVSYIDKFSDLNLCEYGRISSLRSIPEEEALSADSTGMRRLGAEHWRNHALARFTVDVWPY